MSKPTGGPAFPTLEYYDGSPSGVIYGMSLRDWFAGQALLMAGTYRIAEGKESLDSALTVIVRKAYALADAMIAERSREA